MANRFPRIGANASLSETIASVNRSLEKLDKETFTKIINGAMGKPAVLDGMRQGGTFGTDYFDLGDLRISIGQFEWGFGILLCSKTGVPEIFIGMHPVDGHMAIWQAAEGEDVLELLREETQ